MNLKKQSLVTLTGAALAILIAAPASADMRSPSGGRIILAQDDGELSEEELRRLRREKRREEHRQERKKREERVQGEEREERKRKVRREEQRDERQEAKERERRQRQRAEQEEREKRIRERRERQKAEQQEREERTRKRQQAEQEEREERIHKRRERQKAEQQEREEQARERRERRQAQRDEREELEERLREERERKLKEAEERRKRQLERRRRELADQERERRERAKRITEQQEKERKERRANRLERIEGGELSQEERNERRRERREFTRDTLRDIKRARKERRDAEGRLIIEEPGNRRIIRQGKRVIIEEDDSDRLRGGRDVKLVKGPHGRTRTVITRPNGVQIITVRNSDGDIIRRIKKLRNGREIVLFNNEPKRKRHARRDDHDGFSFFIDLPDLRIERPRRDYYVYADRADEDEIEHVLSAEPLEEFDEEYTLDEIRYSPDIRARLRKLNVNTVNFDFGSWEIREDEFYKLEIVARVINRIIDRDESEVFLLAGHTDLVGSDEDNLSLSGRRAETVARILTDEFGVPPENLVTQGYGESDPLIDTEEPEAANRRVEFMRITPALAQYDE